MKLKYYLRGLGVGIVVTAVILTIANHLGNKMSDEDIIKRAAKLGMVIYVNYNTVYVTPEEALGSRLEEE